MLYHITILTQLGKLDFNHVMSPDMVSHLVAWLEEHNHKCSKIRTDHQTIMKLNEGLTTPISKIAVKGYCDWSIIPISTPMENEF